MLNNNTAEQRYELVDGDQVVAVSEYRMEGEEIILSHTEVVPGHEGKGYGSKLARQVLDDLSERGMRVIPACSFMAGYIEKHPQYAGLVVPCRG